MKENNQQQAPMNCFQKLETLNDKLKQLAQIMETMRDGMLKARQMEARK